MLETAGRALVDTAMNGWREQVGVVKPWTMCIGSRAVYGMGWDV